MTKMLEQSGSTWLDREDDAMGWFDTFRWMPREFRDWIANDGLRLEQLNDDEGMIVRAEIPGVDPTVDVDVCVVDGHLSIGVRRRESKQEQGNGHRRSEFRYGDFYRRLALPDGARTDAITATYDKGILDVRIPVEKAAESRVTVVPVESVTA